MTRIFRHSLAAFALLLMCGGAGGYEVDLAAAESARNEFIETMVRTHGFDRRELTELLAGAEILDRVLEAISRPAERVMPWHEYRDIFVTESRIAEGAEFWYQHEEDIAAASARFGVAPEMIVAILGVETLYGRITGSYRVLDSLSTLAFAYPPRSRFFTSELEHFLLLAREEGVDPREMLGSYAGAMGAGQFISSSFRAYAVDGDDDGRRDMWGNWRDVFASVANYFAAHGWRSGQPVVDRATRGASWSDDDRENSIELTETVASASDLGYVFSTEMPSSAAVTLLSLEGRDEQEYWVGYHNFYVITRYNRSEKYALAAYDLSQAIRVSYEALRESRGAASGV
ncbi:MAG TPA: lytic murein transglycosylase B [Gammaproteobacteria bacterium]